MTETEVAAKLSLTCCQLINFKRKGCPVCLNVQGTAPNSNFRDKCNALEAGTFGERKRRF